MFRTSKCLLFLSLFASQQGFSQKEVHTYPSPSAIQYGYGIKLSADISRVEKFSFRLGLSGGVGAFIGKNWLYPSLNGDLMLYHGGIGSRSPGFKGKWLDMEALIAYTATAGFDNRLRYASKARPGERNYPLYYFSNLTLPALQNPYRWSASVGGNIVFLLTRSRYKHQAVGFLNLHADRFQASYANDGPPFGPPLGDRYDRYHTGAGMLSFHGNDAWAINLVEAGYAKFTGYSPSSYEISNKLGNSYVLYKDPDENYYNKSVLQLNIGNTAWHYGVSVAAYNYPRLDFQHRIHNNMYYSLHLVPYKGGIVVSPLFYYQHAQIGLQ